MPTKISLKAVSLGIAFVLSFALIGNAYAAKGSLDDRVGRLERLLGNQVLNEMLDRVNKLQREVQDLRGQLEEANHQVRTMKRRQRDLYLDVDRRLHKIERGGVVTAVKPDAGVPASATSKASAASASKATVTVDPLLEQKSYEKAFKALADGRHAQAKKGFESYLSAFPNGVYSGDSHYWMGEIGYQTRDFDAAQLAFGRLISGYPKSSKLPNALLKSGFIHYEKGEMKAAKRVLGNVVKNYKGTTAARLASNRLKLIKQEGK